MDSAAVGSTNPSSHFGRSSFSWRPWWIGLAIAWTLSMGLGTSRLWDRDEPRNARCTAEMLSANDWVVPTFNGQLRTHKPIWLYWMQGVTYRTFGISAWSARLPSVLMGLLAVGAVVFLARQWMPRTQASWVGGALATSLMFVVAARAATPDASLVAWSAWGVAGLVTSQRERLLGRSLSIQRRYLVLAYAAMGMAMLAKGPVGLVLPCAVAGAWLWLELHLQQRRGTVPGETSLVGWRQIMVACKGLVGWCFDLRAFGRAFASLEPWWGVPLSLAIAAPWYVWVGLRTDGAWLEGFFFEHNLSRAVQSMEGHGGGPWYYPLAALMGLFPWSLLLIPIAMWVRGQWQGSWQGSSSEGVVGGDASVARRASATREGESHDLACRSTAMVCRLGVVWMVIYMLVFSMAKTKLPSYITPCYCGAALLIGGYLSDWSAGRFANPRWLVRTASVVAIVSSLGLMSGLVGLAWQLHDPWLVASVVWVLALMVTGVMAWVWSGSARQANLAGGWLVSASLLWGGLYWHAGSRVDGHRQDLQLLGDLDVGADIAWMAVGTIEPSWVFYLDKPIPEIDVSKEWMKVAVEHLQSSQSRLILSREQVPQLVSAAAEKQLRLRVMAEQPRFLRAEVMAVVAMDESPMAVTGSRSEGVQSVSR